MPNVFDTVFLFQQIGLPPKWPRWRTTPRCLFFDWSFIFLTLTKKTFWNVSSLELSQAFLELCAGERRRLLEIAQAPPMFTTEQFDLSKALVSEFKNCFVPKLERWNSGILERRVSSDTASFQINIFFDICSAALRCLV